jgi:lipoprotein-anchoring transpeptidase ErfK/SrfK
MVRVSPRTFGALVGTAVVAAFAVGGCDAVMPDKPAPKRPPITFTSNVSADQDAVPVDTVVTVSAKNGTVARVGMESDINKIGFKAKGNQWVATRLLEPGTKYTITATGTGSDGKADDFTRSFTTDALTLSQQTYPSVIPLAGRTVGVGMPIIVRFDIPVKNRELFEKHMFVETSKPVEGRWAWFNDREVHFRPKEYWPANTDVTVKVLVNSLPAGDGIYGQKDQVIKFKIGEKVVAYVDVSTFTLTLKENDEVVRTIPVSTGDSKHRSREGTKVIMEKLRKVDMDAATTGVDSEDDDYYDIEDVEYAMRLTNSGEFLHAAPWSVGSQGRANVSHGCTGMSTTNAEYLYGQMKQGDPVEYTGSPRAIEQGNGWTDWNLSWDDWVKKSALKEAPTPTPTPSASASPTPTSSSSMSAFTPLPSVTPTPNGIRTRAPR